MTTRFSSGTGQTPTEGFTAIYIASWPVVTQPSSTLPSGPFCSCWNRKTNDWLPISPNPMTWCRWSRPFRTRTSSRTKKTQKMQRARSLRWHDDVSNILETVPSRPLPRVNFYYHSRDLLFFFLPIICSSVVLPFFSFSFLFLSVYRSSFLTFYRVLSGHFRFGFTAVSFCFSFHFFISASIRCDMLVLAASHFIYFFVLYASMLLCNRDFICTWFTLQ